MGRLLPVVTDVSPATGGSNQMAMLNDFSTDTNIIMNLMQWLASYQPLFTALLVVCSVINTQIYFHHVGSGRTRRDKFGYFRYFWQLWRAGERDGQIAMCLLFVAVVSALILIGTVLV